MESRWQKTMNSDAPGGTRTHGSPFRRRVLYPLSYGRSQERGFPHLANIIITSYIAVCQVREDSGADKTQRWHVNAIGEDPTGDDQPHGKKIIFRVAKREMSMTQETLQGSSKNLTSQRRETYNTIKSEYASKD
jgi:hypothetical protein